MPITAKTIKNLEKRGIVSRKPHPIVPFILAIIILVLGIVVRNIGVGKIWSSSLFFLAGFTLIFALLHLVVVRVLEG
jgi:hypothetical protein